MRNYFPKRPSGAPLHTLSKLYDVPVGFVTPPPYFEAEYCLFCGRRRVAVARYRMICLVHDNSEKYQCFMKKVCILRKFRAKIALKRCALRDVITLLLMTSLANEHETAVKSVM